MTTNPPLPRAEKGSRNKSPWRSPLGISAVTPALDTPALLPGAPDRAAVEFNSAPYCQPPVKPRKLAFQRYSNRRPKAYRYPLEFQLKPDSYLKSIRSLTTV